MFKLDKWDSFLVGMIAMGILHFVLFACLIIPLKERKVQRLLDKAYTQGQIDYANRKITVELHPQPAKGK